MPFDAKKIIEQGWEQGSLFSASQVFENRDLFPGKFVDSIKEDEIFFLTEYSCATVNPKLETEPYVRCIGGSPVPGKKGKPNKHYINAKNSRFLDIELNTDDTARWYRFSINNDPKFDRGIFQDFSPSNQISWIDDQFSIVQDWIILRIIRSAFPGYYEERLKPAKSPLEEIMAEYGDLFTGPYIRIEPNEEISDPDDFYSVSLLLVCRADHIEEYEETLKGVCTQIKEAIENRTTGIEVDECIYKSEEFITIAEIREYKRMTFEYMSEQVGHTGDKAFELSS